MNRMYTREEYLELLGRLKAEVDGLEVTTDVIVGFPAKRRRTLRPRWTWYGRPGIRRPIRSRTCPGRDTRRKASGSGTQGVKKERLLKLNALIAGMIAEQNERISAAGHARPGRGRITGKDGGEAVGFTGGATPPKRSISPAQQPGEMADVEITHAREVSLYGRQTDA